MNSKYFCFFSWPWFLRLAKLHSHHKREVLFFPRISTNNKCIVLKFKEPVCWTYVQRQTMWIFERFSNQIHERKAFKWKLLRATLNAKTNILGVLLSTPIIDIFLNFNGARVKNNHKSNINGVAYDYLLQIIRFLVWLKGAEQRQLVKCKTKQ